MVKLNRLSRHLTMVEDDHLGGFLIEKDPATYMPVLWDFIIKDLNIKSAVDIGCGMGYFIGEVKDKLDYIIGIDGSEYIKEHSNFKDSIFINDFTKSKYETDKIFDLGWSCEFVEHVEEKYVENFMPLFAKCRYVAATYAGPGQKGHNHVNCQPLGYWIDVFDKYGFDYDKEITGKYKKIAYEDAKKQNKHYKNNHFTLRGMFYKNRNLL